MFIFEVKYSFIDVINRAMAFVGEKDRGEAQAASLKGL